MLHLLLPLPYLFQCLGTIFILVSTKIFKNSVSIHSLFTARSPTTRSVKLTITACFCSAFIFRQYTAPKYPPDSVRPLFSLHNAYEKDPCPVSLSVSFSLRPHHPQWGNAPSRIVEIDLETCCLFGLSSGGKPYTERGETGRLVRGYIRLSRIGGGQRDNRKHLFDFSSISVSMDDNNALNTPQGQNTSSEGLNANTFLSPSTPRRNKKKIVYSDRYIPSRSGFDLQAAFSLANSEYTQTAYASASTSNSAEINNSNDPDFLREEEANRTFDSVLKTELFGDNVPMSFSRRPKSSSSINSRAVTPPPDMNNIESGIHSIHNSNVNNGSSRSLNDRSSTSDYTSLSREESLQRTPQRQTGNLFTYQSPSKTRPNSSSLDVQNELYSLSPVRADTQSLLLSPQKKTRNISKMPYRVLDAPDLADDFYLNLVDWGSQDVLAVGLGSSVYLWDGASGSVNHLCDLGATDSICSLSWIGSGTHLAIGTNSGLVEIWDATTCKCTRTMTGHSMRASSLAWNQHILTSGSRDRTILHRDVREPAHFMQRLESHKQEVCGLKWNIEENKLASGGNDNKLFVWEGVNNEPLYTFTEHQAAVKAIAWSPHQRGILASGGGTADRRIKTWNTLTGSKVSDVDTGSQVCNLAWSKNSNELVSTHGYSRNQIVIWKYNTMQQIASLTGHTYRVLYLSMSPDGQTIVTGAGDETLRFWNVFEKTKNDENSSSVLLDAFMQLR